MATLLPERTGWGPEVRPQELAEDTVMRMIEVNSTLCTLMNLSLMPSLRYS